MIRVTMIIYLASLLTACTIHAPLEFHPDTVLQSKKKFDAELKMVSVMTSPTYDKTWGVSFFRVENTTGYQLTEITRQWETTLNDALKQSLIFRNNAPRKISLIVEIQKAEMSGLSTIDYNVAANYRLIDRETEASAYSKTIESRGSAKPSEAFIGEVRARLAFVRSVKTNIEQFLYDLPTTLLQ